MYDVVVYYVKEADGVLLRGKIAHDGALEVLWPDGWHPYLGIREGFWESVVRLSVPKAQAAAVSLGLDPGKIT